MNIAQAHSNKKYFKLAPLFDVWKNIYIFSQNQDLFSNHILKVFTNAWLGLVSFNLELRHGQYHLKAFFPINRFTKYLRGPDHNYVIVFIERNGKVKKNYVSLSTPKVAWVPNILF